MEGHESGNSSENDESGERRDVFLTQDDILNSSESSSLQPSPSIMQEQQQQQPFAPYSHFFQSPSVVHHYHQIHHHHIFHYILDHEPHPLSFESGYQDYPKQKQTAPTEHQLRTTQFFQLPMQFHSSGNIGTSLPLVSNDINRNIISSNLSNQNKYTTNQKLVQSRVTIPPTTNTVGNIPSSPVDVVSGVILKSGSGPPPSGHDSSSRSHSPTEKHSSSHGGKQDIPDSGYLSVVHVEDVPEDVSEDLDRDLEGELVSDDDDDDDEVIWVEYNNRTREYLWHCDLSH